MRSTFHGGGELRRVIRFYNESPRIDFLGKLWAGTSTTVGAGGGGGGGAGCFSAVVHAVVQAVAQAASANAPFTTIAGHVCTAMRGHPVVADAARSRWPR